MFLGLTIGHLTRPQRPLRVARSLEMLAKASACLTFWMPAALATSAIAAGSPILAMASFTLATSALIAAASRVLVIPTDWWKWSSSSITDRLGHRAARKTTRDWSVLEFSAVTLALRSAARATSPIVLS